MKNCLADWGKHFGETDSERDFDMESFLAQIAIELDRDEGTGFAEINGDIISDQGYTGWINHLLGTRFSMKKRFRIWNFGGMEQMRWLFPKKWMNG